MATLVGATQRGKIAYWFLTARRDINYAKTLNWPFRYYMAGQAVSNARHIAFDCGGRTGDQTKRISSMLHERLP